MQRDQAALQGLQPEFARRPVFDGIAKLGAVDGNVQQCPGRVAHAIEGMPELNALAFVHQRRALRVGLLVDPQILGQGRGNFGQGKFIHGLQSDPLFQLLRRNGVQAILGTKIRRNLVGLGVRMGQNDQGVAGIERGQRIAQALGIEGGDPELAAADVFDVVIPLLAQQVIGEIAGFALIRHELLNREQAAEGLIKLGINGPLPECGEGGKHLLQHPLGVGHTLRGQGQGERQGLLAAQVEAGLQAQLMNVALALQ